jgi:hypothetical protein
MQYNRLELVNKILDATPIKRYDNMVLMIATLTDKQLRDYYLNTKK